MKVKDILNDSLFNSDEIVKVFDIIGHLCNYLEKPIDDFVLFYGNAGDLNDAIKYAKIKDCTVTNIKAEYDANDEQPYIQINVNGVR